jgi:predicted lysophospholipase L1 biosynthesis ABC-type transport system permease subunit
VKSSRQATSTPYRGQDDSARAARLSLDVREGTPEPGVTVAQAATNLTIAGDQLATEFPQTNKDRRISAVATTDVRLLVPEASGPVTAGSAGLMAVVGLVLLIGMRERRGPPDFARSSARRREMSVRAALGAGPRRIIGQLLVEGVVIGLAGVVVALGVAWALVHVLLAIKLPIPDLPLGSATGRARA